MNEERDTLSRSARRLATAAVFAAAVALWLLATRGVPRPTPQGSVAERLLGPIAPIAAAVQWTRVDLALRRGDFASAYSRAEVALAWNPRDDAGWIFLAHHLVFERAALSIESDPRERERWIRAGLALLDRAQGEVAEPGEIWLYRGAVMAFLASLDDADRAWPASAAEAWRAAADAFERAAEAGHAAAAGAAERARELGER